MTARQAHDSAFFLGAEPERGLKIAFAEITDDRKAAA